MYQFHRYDPAQPRTVTSFKGNQKLIFEGYRYNIHHIRPAKGVKTWRCVCAKKLTCSRSWCKGRAETWDADSQGISRGEHNHAAEHEVAELEYFKSQLIMAAIASPNANLNDLIDEAVGFMSDGVCFGSRDSLKKSLTVARKAAENGGFKLKCYKSTEAPGENLQNSAGEMKQELGVNEAEGMEMTTMLGVKKAEKAKRKCFSSSLSFHSPPPPPLHHPSSSSPCSSSLLHSSGFHSSFSSSSFSSSSSSSNSSPQFIFGAFAAAAAAALGTGVNSNGTRKRMPPGKSTNGGAGRPKEPKKEEDGSSWKDSREQQQREVVQRKKARVNSIFDRLSSKAAAAAAANGEAGPTNAKMEEEGGEVMGKGKKVEVETQTGDEPEEAEEEEGEPETEEPWRVVRVCCCADKSLCTKRERKRKWMPEGGGEAPGEEDEDERDEDDEEGDEEQSPPPSTSSSVENQPQNGMTEREETEEKGKNIRREAPKGIEADR